MKKESCKQDECKNSDTRDKHSFEKQIFENQLLGYKQAARYLAISEAYLRRLKSQGKIKWVPMGSRGVRFRVSSLNQFIEEREIR